MQTLQYGSGQNQVMPTAFITAGVVPRVGLTDVRHAMRVSWQVRATNGAGTFAGGSGGVTGSWAVLASNNYVHAADAASGGVWSDGTFVDVTSLCTSTVAGVTTPGSIPAATGVAQDFMVTMDNCDFRQIEIRFTPTGGQGPAQRVQAFVTTKSA